MDLVRFHICQRKSFSFNSDFFYRRPPPPPPPPRLPPPPPPLLRLDDPRLLEERALLPLPPLKALLPEERLLADGELDRPEDCDVEGRAPALPPDPRLPASRVEA